MTEKLVFVRVTHRPCDWCLKRRPLTNRVDCGGVVHSICAECWQWNVNFLTKEHLDEDDDEDDE